MFQSSSDLEFCTARTATMLRDTSPTAPEERSLGLKYHSTINQNRFVRPVAKGPAVRRVTWALLKTPGPAHELNVSTS